LRWGEYLFVKKRLAEALDRDLARAARRDPAHPHHVSQLRVFAVWIAMNARYAVVDTFVAGDGKGGTRTWKTDIPALFASHDWMWSDESAARALYDRLRALLLNELRIGRLRERAAR
jgi:hypothetical protein